MQASRALRGDGGQAARRDLALGPLDRQDALERAYAAGAELGPGETADLVQRVCRVTGFTIDPRREHRIQRVRHMDDPRAERDLLPTQPGRIARPVEALVMVPDGRNGVVEEAEPV